MATLQLSLYPVDMTDVSTVNAALGADTGDVPLTGALVADTTSIAFNAGTLMIHLDGDGSSDFTIQLSGVASVTYLRDGSSSFSLL